MPRPTTVGARRCVGHTSGVEHHRQLGQQSNSHHPAFPELTFSASPQGEIGSKNDARAMLQHINPIGLIVRFGRLMNRT